MTTRRPVLRHRVGQDGAAPLSRADTLAVEEPLELRLGEQTFTTTMRTPGHDLDLALGFLVGEGVITGPADVLSARHCPDAGRDSAGEPTHNVVEVQLAPHVPAPAITRHRHVSSACGICGVTSIEEVRSRAGIDVRADEVRVAAGVLACLPERLRAEQRTFARTGGVHAAGLFTPDGDLLCLREDVGRHNAVDKVVGWALQEGRLPLRGSVLQVSGRASFELVQKAVTAGCPVLAAVSAPSSLAVDLATEAGLTLIGFSREAGFNVYSAAGRITG
ncbi:MAG: formate dehydrogenase accessory sulfurtransferase FdhD [Kineosporiaceae bacterium]